MYYSNDQPPNTSLELTGLSWSFAGFEQVAARGGE